MSGKIALIVVHGMGDRKKNYHEKFEEKIKNEIDDIWEDVIFIPIYYQEILQASQEVIFNKMRPHIDWKKSRKFLLYSFSDAASLEHKKDIKGSPYTKTQEMIRDKLQEIYKTCGASIPVVVFAHSLGGQVISNYIWDAQREQANYGVWQNSKANPKDPEDCFLRLQSLVRFYTVGCNIPIFVAGHEKIVAIDEPHKDFKWYNFFDEDDILGWPLRPLSDSYDELVTDISVDAGDGIINFIQKGWNPFSHGLYWQDSAIIGHLAEELRNILMASS